MTTVTAVVAGIVVGLLIGGLGGGGSILAVPVLVYALGMGTREATTASLVIVGVSSLVGVVPHLRAGNVRLVQGLLFGLAGVGGSWLGSLTGRHVDPDVLLASFAALLLVVAALMWRKARRMGRRDDERGDDERGDDERGAAGTDGHRRDTGSRALRIAELLGTATGVGALTGFFGVGGGFAVVPALTLALGFAMPVAVGTSLLVIAVNSASAYLFHSSGGGSIDWAVVLPFLAAAIAGALAGGRLMRRVPQRALTGGFAVFLVLVAVYTAARSVPQLL